MGVVYKAEDTKLRRTVALKFLRADAIEDAEAKERFLREARAAAGLDHPNICTVYEIDEVEGETFLAMAYIEGRTVKDKIGDRPLKLDEAIDIAVQTAEGLKAAHQKGVVHRDIKPANLMLTEEGQLKIMDFGLALLAEQSRLTKTSTILGTPAYMSPEQAERRPTDRRTDVWSLGVVIYEMVTGRLPFAGERQEAVLYAISNQEPEPVTALRAGLPMELEFIVAKALAKDPADRYQHVEEMIVDLRGLAKKSGSRQSVTPRSGVGLEPPAPRPREERPSPDLKLRLYQALLAATGVAALAMAFLYFGGAAPETDKASVNRFAITPPDGVWTIWLHANVAISPNGRHVAFVRNADRKLWVKDLDQQEPRAIEGSEGARAPFWAPGSDFIGFATDSQLKRAPVHGGPAVTLCELPAFDFWGAAWSTDSEMIVFSSRVPSELYEVPARGGRPDLLISTKDLENTTGQTVGWIARPHFLPAEAGPRVLAFVFGAETGHIVIVQDLDTGRHEVLGPGEAPFYAPSGHLVYQPAGRTYDLWARSFDLDTLKPTGEAFPIARNGRGPTVSADGTLVYLDGLDAIEEQLVWLDRDGETVAETGLKAAAISSPTLSADGRRIAVAIGGANEDVWVYDRSSGTKTRLTTAAEDENRPVWSPDGQQIAFASERAGNNDVLLRPAAGGGEDKELVATPLLERPWDWSIDGRYLLYEASDPGTEVDIWYLERGEDGGDWKPRPFLQTRFGERAAKFSPDGRYVAYHSDESGRFEIYVQPFPEGGRKVTVSSNGGTNVRWSPDGSEIFYVEGGTLVAVRVSMSDQDFSVGAAAKLFHHPKLGEWQRTNYDVSPDGRRFLVPQVVGETAHPAIRVVQNWFEEFRERERE